MREWDGLYKCLADPNAILDPRLWPRSAKSSTAGGCRSASGASLDGPGPSTKSWRGGESQPSSQVILVELRKSPAGRWCPLPQLGQQPGAPWQTSTASAKASENRGVDFLPWFLVLWAHGRSSHCEPGETTVSLARSQQGCEGPHPLMCNMQCQPDALPKV